jgi:16S rRNA G966 N2-methylase RsmD
MVKIIWSFGNNGQGYLFGKDIEQDKKSIHMAVVFNEFDNYAKEVFGMVKFRDGFDISAKRLFLKNRIKLLGKDRLDLQQLERLERLQQLERLEQLERLQQLAFYNSNYSDVPIKENSVIYCDPPYAGTADYGSNFNTKNLLDWADAQQNPVFISEYNIKDSRFTCIANFKKRSLLSANKDNELVKTEKVYVNKSGYAKLLSRGK